MSTSDLARIDHGFVFFAIEVADPIEWWVFEGNFPVFGRQQHPNRAYRCRPGRATPRVGLYTVVTMDRPGLSRREPGCNVEE